MSRARSQRVPTGPARRLTLPALRIPPAAWRALGMGTLWLATLYGAWWGLRALEPRALEIRRAQTDRKSVV